MSWHLSLGFRVWALPAFDSSTDCLAMTVRARYIPFTQPHLQGMPYLESTHWGSLRDIPPGAQRIDPGRIPFVPGTPTDISQAPRDECEDLIYTVAGWFCPNPNCTHRNTGGFLTAFPRIGEFYG
ncbi:MAG: hypothetical protein ABSB26_00315 [Nitrososphaerales archaeon]